MTERILPQVSEKSESQNRSKKLLERARDFVEKRLAPRRIINLMEELQGYGDRVIDEDRVQIESPDRDGVLTTEYTFRLSGFNEYLDRTVQPNVARLTVSISGNETSYFLIYKKDHIVELEDGSEDTIVEFIRMKVAVNSGALPGNIILVEEAEQRFKSKKGEFDDLKQGETGRKLAAVQLQGIYNLKGEAGIGDQITDEIRGNEETLPVPESPMQFSTAAEQERLLRHVLEELKKEGAVAIGQE